MDFRITVRSGFAPDVQFPLHIFGGTKGVSEPEIARRIKQAWTQVTGLAFEKMDEQVHESSTITLGQMTVANPLDNRGAVCFIWEVVDEVA